MADQVKDEIVNIIQLTLPQYGRAHSLANHLMGPAIGISAVGDLRDVTALDLEGQELGSVQMRKLLRALKAFTEGNDQQSNVQQQSVSRRTPLRAFQVDPSIFTFEVRWDQYDKDLLAKFQASIDAGVPAAARDIKKLRLAIVGKLKSSYTTHKENFLGQQKSPGRVIYTSITDQVFDKFGLCLKDIINGKEMGDGKSTFFATFETCCENQFRPSPGESSRVNKKAKVARGAVGVLPSQHRPNISEAEEEEQEGSRNYLITAEQLQSSLDLDLEQIDNLMETSFKLQRKHIYIANLEVEKEKENDNLEDEDENSDEPTPKAICALKLQWPFLFKSRWLSKHHFTLTNKNLDGPLTDFVENSVDDLTKFLCAGKMQVKNTAVSKKMTTCGSPAQKILGVIMMVANFFGEDFKEILITVPKTTRPEELGTMVHGSPCIVAFDSNAFQAERFVVCVDQVPLISAKNPIDSLREMIELAFVLDADYAPKAPLTMEFIERVIFSMALDCTKVRDKKERLLLTVTKAVMNLVNSFEPFQKELRDEEASLT